MHKTLLYGSAPFYVSTKHFIPQIFHIVDKISKRRIKVQLHLPFSSFKALT